MEVTKRLVVFQPNRRDYRWARWVTREIPNFDISADEYVARNAGGDLAHLQGQVYYHGSVVKEMKEKITGLFEAIKHGDEEHQAWLKEKIEKHFEMPR